MRQVSLYLFLAVVLTIAVTNDAGAARNEQTEYFSAVSNYFDISPENVDDILSTGIVDHDLPVVVFIAQKASVSMRGLAERKSAGESWSAIAANYNLSAVDFYKDLGDLEIISKTFLPVYERFQTLPEEQWGTIVLSSTDIVNLVNMRFVSENVGVLPAPVMNAKDVCLKWVKIYHDFAASKSEQPQQAMVPIEDLGD
jgi:hypothetical protein